jgi:hypothetical protein
LTSFIDVNPKCFIALGGFSTAQRMQHKLQGSLTTALPMQAFLYAFLTERYRWTPLPAEAALLTAFYAMDRWYWEAHIRNAALIHFVGPPDIKVMVDKIAVSPDGSKILNTTDGQRGEYWGFLDATWNDAWTEARLALQLPMPARRPPSGNMVSGILPEGAVLRRTAAAFQMP